MESTQQHTKLFVGGVSKETTEDTLIEHFSRFGQVEESLIIRDRLTGIGRGFGFVTFSDSSMANEALKEKHVILRRKVDVKPANSKGNRQQQSSEYGSYGDSDTQYNTKKIFVGGLPPNLSEEEFKNYFESFGTVTDVVVISDKENHRPRGFGFITFDSERAVDNVLKNSFHELNNKMVEVKRAEPKDRKSINYYDCYHTGLDFGRGYPYGYCGNYPTFIPFYCYPLQPPGYTWNHYGFGAPTGDWVRSVTVSSSNLNGYPSSHDQLASENPSARNLVFHPSYFSSGVYMNGWASHCNGNYHHTTESTTSCNSNTNRDNDIGHVEPLSTTRSPQIDDLSSSKREHKRREIEDSSGLESNVAKHQNGEIDDSSGRKISVTVHQNGEIGNSSSSATEHQNRMIDNSLGAKGSVVEYQNGEVDSSNIET